MPRARWGAWWARHPRLLKIFVMVALCWALAYLTWRVGFSLKGANPVLWAVLLVTEIFGVWNIATQAWLTWDVRRGERPPATEGRGVDVYVCTYDEPPAVLEPTLAGCALLRYPHTTWVLDDGKRPEVKRLAETWGARYITREENSHAKAGNINNALSHTDGELVMVLDADHVPMPDALDALVGYFDDPRIALVQTPHDFYNHDSVQHYDLGRHEQSVFFGAICPGKDRHDAAYWCGSSALLRREALLEVGGVATETVAEDFHTTIKLHSAGWRTRYDGRVVVQGLAPHDPASYLLQRDRWARGNLAVLATPENPVRARGLSLAQRASYLVSLSSYLAGPMRLLIIAIVAAILWTGAMPLRMSPIPLTVSLWAPATLLLMLAGSALCRGFKTNGETVHYELCTAEIFTRALRCAVRPSRGGFRVTPKEGVDRGGWQALRQFKLLMLFTLVLAGGVAARLANDAGADFLPHMQRFASLFVPALGLIELGRLARTLLLIGGRRQLRAEYRTPLESSAIVEPRPPSAAGATAGGSMPLLGSACDITLSGLAIQLSEPLAEGSHARATVHLPAADGGASRSVTVDVAARSCRGVEGQWRIGTSIEACSEEARRHIIEYCHVVWPYMRLHGIRPAPEIAPVPVSEPQAPAIGSAAPQSAG